MISTTSLLVEHLLSGFMALVWIGLILSNTYPSSLEFAIAAGSESPLALIGLAVFGYPIGIIIDNIADAILSPIKNKSKNLENYVSVTELLHHLKDDNILSWFKYNRFKIRVMRACFLNSLLTILVLIGSNLFKWPNYVGPLLVFYFLVCVLSYITWRKEVTATYKSVEKWRGYIDK